MDYKTMASAYRQYAQTRSASNASTSSSSKGLGSPSVKTTTPKQQEEKKPSIMERFIGAFSSSGGSIKLDQKRPDPLRVYDMPNMQEIQDYNTRTNVTDALYEAQGTINQAYTPQMRSETRPMTAEEIKKFAPVKELSEKGITVEQLSSMDAPMQKATLESLGITNAKFVSSAMENMYPMSLQEFDQMTMDSVVRGTPRREMPPVPRPENVDPETGQPIQSMADVVATDVAQTVQPATPSAGLMSRTSFTESQPEDSILGGLFNVIPDAFQVSNWLTGGNKLDGTQGEKVSDTTESRPEQGPVLYPSNERSVITYARDIYPDNPKAAAALAATIQFEGMENAEEDVSKYSWKNITNSSSPAGWLKKSITDNNKPWAKKRTNKLYELYGGKPKKDAEGNTIPLTREPTKEELKAVQTKLKERGFYNGAIDGVFGRGSKAALKKFQGIENSKLETMSGDYPKMPENGELDRYTAMFFDLELYLKDHEGNVMIEFERPTNPVVPAGEKVVDITYNPYYRANGYIDELGDVSKEGLDGNTPGAGTFRGRGPVQLTNKAMYEKLRDKVLSETGVDIVKNPSAVANDLYVSRVATEAFLNEVGFDKLSPREALKVINPQMPEEKMNKRLEVYEKYLKEMQN